MAILLGLGLIAVLFFYGRAILVQLSKSFREAGIFILVLLGVIAMFVLIIYASFP